MKKIKLIMAAVMAMGVFAHAGGDVSPVEPELNIPFFEEETSMVEPSDTGFYAGVAYSYVNSNFTPGDVDTSGHGVALVGGYTYNKYLAVEARYTRTLSDLTEDDGTTELTLNNGNYISNCALYLKPMYPIGEANVYGLLGYGKTTLADDDMDESENGFQWGLGANYPINDKLVAFADYTRVYDDSDGFGALGSDTMVDSINVGVSYKF